MSRDDTMELLRYVVEELEILHAYPCSGINSIQLILIYCTRVLPVVLEVLGGNAIKLSLGTLPVFISYP